MSLRTQTGFEAGRSTPDSATLQRWSAIGADVFFIITGHPSAASVAEAASALAERSRILAGTPPARLAEEAAILLLLRKLPDGDLAVVRRMIEGLAR